jgi:hypothetical protein
MLPFSKASEQVSSQIDSIIEYIIRMKRQKNQLDLHQAITAEERQAVIIDALGTYKFLSERSVNDNGKILVEYRKGISKIIEEVVLFDQES